MRGEGASRGGAAWEWMAAWGKINEKSKVGLGNLRERKKMIYLFLHECIKRMWSPAMLCTLVAAKK